MIVLPPCAGRLALEPRAERRARVDAFAMDPKTRRDAGGAGAVARLGGERKEPRRRARVPGGASLLRQARRRGGRRRGRARVRVVLGRRRPRFATVREPRRRRRRRRRRGCVFRARDVARSSRRGQRGGIGARRWSRRGSSRSRSPRSPSTTRRARRERGWRARARGHRSDGESLRLEARAFSRPSHRGGGVQTTGDTRSDAAEVLRAASISRRRCASTAKLLEVLWTRVVVLTDASKDAAGIGMRFRFGRMSAATRRTPRSAFISLPRVWRRGGDPATTWASSVATLFPHDT